MPNRYQREIEEILRNMDHPENKPGLGSRMRSFNRPRPRRQRSRGSWHLPLNASEVCMLSGILIVLLAVGLAFYFGAARQPLLFGDNPLSGWLGLAGFLLFLTGLAIGWYRSFIGGRVSTPSWRGNDLSNSNRSASTSEGNVVRFSTARRRNPISALATQLRILRLKIRYQRMRERDSVGNSENEN